MTIHFDRIKQFRHQARTEIDKFLWQQQLSELQLGRRILVRSCQIFVAVVRDLVQGQLSLRAMGLVFTTMIGFFPLLALSFAVLKSFGVHNALEPNLLALLEPLGERANEITQDMLTYVDNIQVQLIGITSITLLLYIVLDMMRKIEGSFNYIWAVKQGRSLSSRISKYLFAVIVSPLLLFLSISITGSVNTSLGERILENLSYGGEILGVMANVTSILLMSLAFAFANGFLPNTRVKFGSALIGGFVTTIIWKFMGYVFQDIIVSAARESIYLAFGTAIAVLFFTYFGWLAALIGSSIAFYHQNPAKTRSGRETPSLSITQQEELSLALASIIIRRFDEGLEALSEGQLAAKLSNNPIVIESSLDALESIGLITRTADDPVRFMPRKPISDCSLVEIWQELRAYNTDPLRGGSASADLLRVREFQTELDSMVEQQLGNKRFVDPAN
jgi:membrane protein